MKIATNKKTGEKFTLSQLAKTCKSEFSRKEVQELLESLMHKVEPYHLEECKKEILDFMGVHM